MSIRDDRLNGGDTSCNGLLMFLALFILAGLPVIVSMILAIIC